MVICLERGAYDLHMVQLIPLPLHLISCFIKIQIGLTFPVPAYPGCPRKEAVKRVSLCLSWEISVDNVRCHCQSHTHQLLLTVPVIYLGAVCRGMCPVSCVLCQCRQLVCCYGSWIKRISSPHLPVIRLIHPVLIGKKKHMVGSPS